MPIMGARRMLATVFNRMSAHDVVAWNAMIFAHAQCGKGQKALKLYQQM
jgi:pentatricopeptide repeat protein